MVQNQMILIVNDNENEEDNDKGEEDNEVTRDH